MSLTLYLFIPVDWSISISLHVHVYIPIYIYLLLFVCIYIFHTHSHYIFFLLWTKDISLPPHQLSCHSCWGVSLFSPPAFMLLILPNGPEKLQRERLRVLLPPCLPDSCVFSCLLALLLRSVAMLTFSRTELPSFSGTCHQLSSFWRIFPPFHTPVLSFPFCLERNHGLCPSLPARVRLDFCLAVLQKLLSLGLSVFSGFPTPIVSFQTMWPTPCPKFHLLAFLLLSKAFFFILFNWLIKLSSLYFLIDWFCCPFLRDQKALLTHPLFSYFIHFRVSLYVTVLSFRIFHPCHINCASPPCPTGTSKFLWPKQNVLTVEYCCCYCCLVTKSCLTLMTPWIAASQAPVSTGFPRQEYWSGLPFPSPGDLLNWGTGSAFPALAGGFFITEPPGKYYSALKMERALTLAITWVSLKDIILSEISQSLKNTCCTLPFIGGP